MISIAAAKASIASWIRPPSWMRYLLQLEREFGLGCAATGDNLFALNHNADHHQRIVHGPFEFVDHVFCAAPDNDRDRFRVPALRDIDHLIARELPLLDKAGRAEILWVIWHRCW